eukprot:CAMPEP_0119116268 /NCGR_PEP_ID=MMETSP1180-20130426/52189_1 /TAXON_ID=3052 ORGANISM="Chlamydomonas cf sp, Strain CCMP681" /NCGR_SAMPLE_ID=MMETSP1180 /ASSEMBLY_ACC=CAM_ASM_000741 /LENGTH=453 /DNA_ID=CAMNT_0007105397 /DNA_START=135 /DNA_END=1497 /DNA_ORIENTATION=-
MAQHLQQYKQACQGQEHNEQHFQAGNKKLVSSKVVWGSVCSNFSHAVGRLSQYEPPALTSTLKQLPSVWDEFVEEHEHLDCLTQSLFADLKAESTRLQREDVTLTEQLGKLRASTLTGKAKKQTLKEISAPGLMLTYLSLFADLKAESTRLQREDVTLTEQLRQTESIYSYWKGEKADFEGNKCTWVDAHLPVIESLFLEMDAKVVELDAAKNELKRKMARHLHQYIQARQGLEHSQQHFQADNKKMVSSKVAWESVYSNFSYAVGCLSRFELAVLISTLKQVLSPASCSANTWESSGPGYAEAGTGTLPSVWAVFVEEHQHLDCLTQSMFEDLKAESARLHRVDVTLTEQLRQTENNSGSSFDWVDADQPDINSLESDINAKLIELGATEDELLRKMAERLEQYMQHACHGQEHNQQQLQGDCKLQGASIAAQSAPGHTSLVTRRAACRAAQ